MPFVSVLPATFTVTDGVILLPVNETLEATETVPPAIAATVTFGGKVLQEGKDYTISYRNNLNVGVTTVPPAIARFVIVKFFDV